MRLLGQRLVRLFWLGRVNYVEAMALQEGLAEEMRVRMMKNGERDCMDSLLLLEHDPVYTIGIRSKDYSLDEERRLSSLGAEFVRSDRGGLITFHGPGQLIAYPILNLNNFGKAGSPLSVRCYVHNLEQVAIDTCLSLGLDGARRSSSNPGVWIDENNSSGESKLCAVGIRCSNSITKHGIALNCNNDLSWFNHIVACGLPGKGVTSLSKMLGREVTVSEAASHLVSSFQDRFGCQIVMQPGVKFVP